MKFRRIGKRKYGNKCKFCGTDLENRNCCDECELKFLDNELKNYERK